MVPSRLFPPRAVAPPAAALLLAQVCAAQIAGGSWETDLQIYGRMATRQMGQSIAKVGDVDGDGVPDLLVGAISYQRVFLFSGADGSRLKTVASPAATWVEFGAAVTGLGDVDGDGVPDFAVGAPETNTSAGNDAGALYAFSGGDGSIIFQIMGQYAGERLGIALQTVGDVNGDGVLDIGAGFGGAPNGILSGAGIAYVYSGANGAMLHTVRGTQASQHVSPAEVAGDLDLDGHDDFLLSRNGDDITVYSGATGATLLQFSTVMFRGSASAGDLDGDGIPDLFIGRGSGWEARSGADGSVLHPYVFAGGHSSMRAAGDVDGDGTEDLLIGNISFQGSTGEVLLYSGRTAELIGRAEGTHASGRLGTAVTSVGDLDGDGRPEFAATAPHASSPRAMDTGLVEVFRFDPFLRADAWTAAASAPGAVHFQLDFPASEALQDYLLLASASGTGPTQVYGLDVPLTPDPVFQSILAGSAPAALQGAYGTLDGNASAQATLAMGPPLAPAVGLTLQFAALTFDGFPAAGRIASAPCYVTVLP